MIKIQNVLRVAIMYVKIIDVARTKFNKFIKSGIYISCILLLELRMLLNCEIYRIDFKLCKYFSCS